MTTQMPEFDLKWLASILKRSFHEKKPAELLEISVMPGSPLGQNFMSTVDRVKITMLLSSGKKKTFSMIVKNQTTGGKVESVMGDMCLFPVEIKVYTDVLPKMEALMDEFNDKRDKIWCNCYGYQPYSMVVMEDLVSDGYNTIDRTKWQNLKQSQMVLRALARFHAMSKILIKNGKINEDHKGSNMFLHDSHTYRTIFPASVQALSNAILKKWGKEWEDVGLKVAENVHCICDKMRAATPCDKKYEVFNHGDLWTANIMWKFTEYGNVPTSVKFVDWQFSHTNSFIIDVAYFLFTSVVPSIRRDNLDLLLETYQGALEKNLKFFNWEGYVPTMEDVKSEYDRVGILSFIFLGLSMPVTSTGVNALCFDIGNLFDQPPETIFNEAIYIEEKYVKEAAQDIRNFCQNGVL